MELKKIVAVRTNKTVYRDGNHAVKVFDEDFVTSNVLNEALNQARVQEAGLNVPGVVEVLKIDGKWAIVSDFIEGKTLQQLMDEHPEKLDEYLNMFVNIQLDMHSRKAPNLNKLQDKMHAKISASTLTATNRYELHTRLNAMPRHDKVCHGDFNPSNIIIRNDGTPFILDWSHATQGNASADAARTYLLFSLANQTDLAEKYLVLFCKKADIARQYVQQWIPIVAASQSVKGKPEEREFLLRWADVVDFE